MKPYLLLQCRLTEDAMRDHEWECVARALGCRLEQVERVNLSERLPTDAELSGAAALMIGGSGAFHVYDEAPWIGRCIDWVGELLQNVDRPILGMCFGHQALLMASGAQIINDPDNEQLGTYQIELTEAGRRDPVFAGLPPAFDVQLGHVDRAKTLPPGWSDLAVSQRQKMQAVRRIGEPVWGFQFHAELRMEDNLYRVRNYADHYAAGRDEVFDRLVARHRETPLGTAVMRGFARTVAMFWETGLCASSSPLPVSL
jgi:GMP synthase (glutamine-hydrolysing)